MIKLVSTALVGAAALAAASAVAGTPQATTKPQKKTVTVQDNYSGPTKETVNRDSLITWRWTDESADVHDVKLVSGPKGFRKFQTEPASAGYRYSKRLTKPGTYKFVCTLHEDDGMKMTIVVRH
jgi:plastocyanin